MLMHNLLYFLYINNIDLKLIFIILFINIFSNIFLIFLWNCFFYIYFIFYIFLMISCIKNPTFCPGYTTFFFEFSEFHFFQNLPFIDC